MKYSIIIPSYNNEKYINECLNSFVDMQITEDINYEILFIDDGSTDNTKKKIDEYKSKINITYVYQENAGVSCARNHGLSLVSDTTDYVLFVDSDDKISKDTLINASKFFNEHKCDIAVMKIQRFGDYDKIIDPNGKLEHSFIDITQNYECAQYYIGGTFLSKRIIDKYKYSFDENLSLFEDTIFITKYILKCGGYGVIKNAIYFYRYIESGDSAVNNVKKNKKRYVYYLRNIYPILMNYNYDDKYHKYISYLIIYHQRESMKYDYISMLSEEELNEYVKEFRNLVSKLDESVIFSIKPKNFAYKVLNYCIFGDSEILRYTPKEIEVVRVGFNFLKLRIEIDIKAIQARTFSRKIRLGKETVRKNPYETTPLEDDKVIVMEGLKIYYPQEYILKFRLDRFDFKYRKYAVYLGNEKVMNVCSNN